MGVYNLIILTNAKGVKENQLEISKMSTILSTGSALAKGIGSIFGYAKARGKNFLC